MNEAAKKEKKGIRVLVRIDDARKLKNLDRKVDGGCERLLEDFEEVDRIPEPNEQRSSDGNGTSGVGTIHYEGDAVCQSGGSTWQDPRRIVWAPSSDRYSVLFLGYLPQHVGKKGKPTPAYNRLKARAKTVTPEDFLNAVDAREAIAAQKHGKESAKESVDKAREKTPFEKLKYAREAAMELMEGASDEKMVKVKELLKEDVRNLLTNENEKLSNNQRWDLTKVINSLPKEDLLRIAYNEVVEAIKEESQNLPPLKGPRGGRG